MATETKWIRFDAGERLSGYLARPTRAATPLPGVVVIQEAWGLDEHIEDVTRRIAQAGYVALAPDLYARDGERPAPLSRPRLAELQAFVNELPPGGMLDEAARAAALSHRPADQQQRLRESLQTMMGGLAGGLERHLPPVLAAADWLRKEAAPSGGAGVAAIGFCMGGGLAALAAAHDPALRGAAIFYGSAPPAALVPAIACPVIGFYGELDRRITDALPAFAELMSAQEKSFEPHVYAKAQHAFFNDNRPSYDVRAARDSFVRLLGFLERVLA